MKKKLSALTFHQLESTFLTMKTTYFESKQAVNTRTKNQSIELQQKTTNCFPCYCKKLELIVKTPIQQFSLRDFLIFNGFKQNVTKTLFGGISSMSLDECAGDKNAQVG